MTFTPENIFFLGAVLIFASIVISKWGYRFGVPTLLLFLFTGMLFGIELPEELESKLSEIILTEESLSDGNRLMDMHFPQGTLVMMIKRGNSFIVPNGQLELRVGDILLTIASQQSK